MLRTRQFLLFLLPLTALATAAEPQSAASSTPAAAPSPEMRTAARAHAGELREQATKMKRDADARHKETQNACYRKFLVNDCLDQAKRDLRAKQVEARKLESEAREIERSLQRVEVGEREAKRLADAPRREAEKQREAAAARAEQEETRLKLEERRAEKARKLGGGPGQ